MANDTDFLTLYRELDIGPDCTPDEFRKAYRRRVAKIHPDRRPAPVDQTRQLQRLNVLYAAAVQFERQHGRLPGAARIVPPRANTPTRPVSSVSQPGAPRRRYLFLLLLVVVIVIVSAYWDGYESPASVGQSDANPPHQIRQANSIPVRPAPSIHLGMSAEDVRVIQGEPRIDGANTWEFGPSWIAFQCKAVSDWYSSPLRPLKVDTRRPERRDIPIATGSCNDLGSSRRSTSGSNFSYFAPRARFGKVMHRTD